MSMLVEDWVSRASAMQRKGRAGRVRAGRCYCLYTRVSGASWLLAWGMSLRRAGNSLK